MRFRKTLSSWLVTKYLLIIRNEENFAEKTTFSFTYSKVILFAVSIFIVMLVIALLLINTLLSQWYDPAYSQEKTRKELNELTSKIDSLSFEVEAKDRFIKNIQRVISGDSLVTEESFTQRSAQQEQSVVASDLSSLAPIDSQFRQKFEQSDFSLVSNANSSLAELNQIYFYSPLTGLISDRYNIGEEHYGVDIVSKKNEAVKVVADGTVIFASWTQDSGHVIAVQHRGDLISVYKHNAQLLKKVGNFVSGGEIISIVGNTGELTDGPHLHFELWYNGSPVNPEEFVSF